jgi:hypothetical protein
MGRFGRPHHTRNGRARKYELVSGAKVLRQSQPALLLCELVLVIGKKARRGEVKKGPPSFLIERNLTE